MMNLTEDTVQTHTPQFVDLGLSTINALDEGSGISTPATRILSPTDGAHWGAPTNILVETTSIGVSKAKSDYDYNYKIYFQIWNENKEFECQNISRSQLPMDLTPVGMKMSDAKISPSDSTAIGEKLHTPKH